VLSQILIGKYFLCTKHARKQKNFAVTNRNLALNGNSYICETRCSRKHIPTKTINIILAGKGQMIISRFYD